MEDRVLNLIGLARRAGHVQSGDAAVRSVIERGRARVIILAGDSSARTKKAFGRLAAEAGIPLTIYSSKDNLGRILGKPSRSVVAVTDDNFARGIANAMERGEVIEK